MRILSYVIFIIITIFKKDIFPSKVQLSRGLHKTKDLKSELSFQTAGYKPLIGPENKLVFFKNVGQYSF